MAGPTNQSGNTGNTPLDFEATVALKIVEIMSNGGKLLDYMKKLNPETVKANKNLDKYNKALKQTNQNFEKLKKVTFHFAATLGNVTKTFKTASTAVIGFSSLMTAMVAHMANANKEFMDFAISSKNVDKSMAHLKQTYLAYAKSVEIATLSQQDFADIMAQFKGQSFVARYISETDANFTKLFTSIPTQLAKTLDKDHAKQLWSEFAGAFDPAQLQKMLSDFDFNSEAMGQYALGMGGPEAFNTYSKIQNVLNGIEKSENDLLAPIRSWNKLWNSTKSMFQNISTQFFESFGDELPKILDKLGKALLEIPPIVQKITNYIKSVNWEEKFDKVASVVKYLWEKFNDLPAPLKVAVGLMVLPGASTAMSTVLGLVKDITFSVIGAGVQFAATTKAMAAFSPAAASAYASLESFALKAGMVSVAIGAMAVAAKNFYDMWDNFDWDKNRSWDTALASENNMGSKMVDWAQRNISGMHPDVINEKENEKWKQNDLFKQADAKRAKKYKVSVDIVSNWRGAGGDAGDFDEYLKKNKIAHFDPKIGQSMAESMNKVKDTFSKGGFSGVWNMAKDGVKQLKEGAKETLKIKDSAKQLFTPFQTAIGEFQTIMTQSFATQEKILGHVTGTMTNISELMGSAGLDIKLGNTTIGATANSMAKKSISVMKQAEDSLQRAAVEAQKAIDEAVDPEAKDLAIERLATITGELLKVKNTLAQSVSLQNKPMEVFLERQEKTTSLLQTQLEISKSLYGAPLMSIAGTQKVIQSLQQEQGLLEGQLANVREGLAVDPQNSELLRQELDLQNQIQQKLLERVNITKELRDGYLDAVTAQAFGAGKFEKLIVTQEKNIGIALRQNMVKKNYLVGSTDKMSQAGPTAFSADGIGSMTGSDGQPLTPEQMAAENQKRINTVSDPLTKSLMQSSQQLVNSVNTANKANSSKLTENTTAIQQNNDLLEKYLQRGTANAGVGGLKGTPGEQTLIGGLVNQSGGGPLLKAVERSIKSGPKTSPNTKKIKTPKVPSLVEGNRMNDILGYDLRSDAEIASTQAKNKSILQGQTKGKGSKLNVAKAGHGPTAAGVKQIAKLFQSVIDIMSNIANGVDNMSGTAAPMVPKERPGRGKNIS